MNKNYLRQIFLLSTLSFAFHLSGYSQTQEIGLRMASFQNFDFIYKKEKQANKFIRYRLVFANIGLESQNDSENITAQLGIAIGIENRRAINEKFYFVHGIEPSFSFRLATNSTATNWNFQPGLGYVLGFQYNINDEFYVNMETIPALTVGINVRENAVNTYLVNAGVNSNAISVTLAYRFTGKIRK